MRRISPLQIVLLSGRIGAGKTSLADQLVERHNACLIKTRDLIRVQLPATRDDRRALQRAGERLDRETQGRWVGDALARRIEEIEGAQGLAAGLYVLDAVRIPGQVKAVRESFGSAVHHIHLTASESLLKERWDRRAAASDAGVTFEQATRNGTERQVNRLAEVADTLVSTDRCSPAAVLVRATALLGLYSRSFDPLVDVLVGGQYGSEGKGNIVGHIAPEYDLFVRVGGPNAGHKVYAEPEPEAYFHLPSGTDRAPNAKLLLGPGAVIYPPKLLEEVSRHKVSVERLCIDPRAMIIEDEDKALEAELLATMGSTTQGVGAASARKIMGRGGKVEPSVRLAKDVPELRPYIREGQDVLERAYRDGQRILLEGTQGTGLSVHHGPYPHVTSRDTTVSGCLADAGIAPRRVGRIICVFRTFPIRVAGASGDLYGEISYEELARRSGIDERELRGTEMTTTTKKQRRVGEFDWEQLRRSCVLNGPTDIALTFVDYLGVANRQAYRYEQLSSETIRFVEEVERVAGQPVTLLSTKFSYRNVIDRRSW